MIKILIVDDHGIVRLGIKRLLQEVPGMKVIGEAATGEEAIRLAKELMPDVILMDVEMPGIGGYEATCKIIRNNPDVKVLILTMLEESPYPTRFLKIGAAGYLSKGCDATEMIKAIRATHLGQRYLSQKIAQQLALKRFAPNEASPLEQLSERELQVMLMITKGKKVQEISAKLCLSPKTVNSYRYRLFEKLKVENDVELTLLAMRLGLIEKIINEEV